jgi:hypothetical protein
MHIELRSIARYEDDQNPSNIKSIVTGKYICTAYGSSIAIFETNSKQFQAKVDIGLALFI